MPGNLERVTVEYSHCYIDDATPPKDQVYHSRDRVTYCASECGRHQ